MLALHHRRGFRKAGACCWQAGSSISSWRRSSFSAFRALRCGSSAWWSASTALRRLSAHLHGLMPATPRRPLAYCQRCGDQSQSSPRCAAVARPMPSLHNPFGIHENTRTRRRRRRRDDGRKPAVSPGPGRLYRHDPGREERTHLGVHLARGRAMPSITGSYNLAKIHAYSNQLYPRLEALTGQYVSWHAVRRAAVGERCARTRLAEIHPTASRRASASAWISSVSMRSAG